jgi:hypothetical protein
MNRYRFQDNADVENPVADKFQDAVDNVREIGAERMAVAMAKEYILILKGVTGRDRLRMLATIIHHHDCHIDHNTQWCNWYYDKGSWRRSNRVEYLKKAEEWLNDQSSMPGFDAALPLVDKLIKLVKKDIDRG